jgi:hypothetical protein
LRIEGSLQLAAGSFNNKNVIQGLRNSSSLFKPFVVATLCVLGGFARNRRHRCFSTLLRTIKFSRCLRRLGGNKFTALFRKGRAADFPQEGHP